MGEETSPRTPLAVSAAEINRCVVEHFPAGGRDVQQVLCLAEEVGEFVAAYRRWSGRARRSGPWSDVCDELADVVIAAYVTADVLGIDLDAAAAAKVARVVTRGWREGQVA